MRMKSVRLVLLCLVAIAPARADELLDAAQAMCDKVKACAMEKMAKENVSAEERQRAQPALEGMCDSVKQQVAETLSGHPQYANALGCMRSMLGLSCAQLQDETQAATSECVAYEKQLRDAPAPQGP